MNGSQTRLAKWTLTCISRNLRFQYYIRGHVLIEYGTMHNDKYSGVVIAMIIMVLWTMCFYILVFRFDIQAAHPVPLILAFFVMTFLYTGMFITAHDAMHGNVSSDRLINDAIGYITSFVFAGFWFPTMKQHHSDHHKYTSIPSKDPDYHRGNPNFLVWLYHFMHNYMSIGTCLGLFVIVQCLTKLGAKYENMVVFMAGAGLVSALQLFYFGTYLPHRPPSGMPLARISRKTHCESRLQSFLECYHFGCHDVHHANPRIPWWKLWDHSHSVI